MSSSTSNRNRENKVSPPFGPPDCVWKEMTPDSTLPESVVPGGGTLNGDEIYIGRVYHNNALLIGTAIPSKGVCLFLSDNSVESSSSYEILAVDCGNPLEFQKTDLDSRLLFNAGKDDMGDILYVGRYVTDGDTYVGWIQRSTKSLFIPISSELRSPKVEEDYDVLIHKYLDRLCICPPCPPRRGIYD